MWSYSQPSVYQILQGTKENRLAPGQALSWSFSNWLSGSVLAFCPITSLCLKRQQISHWLQRGKQISKCWCLGTGYLHDLSS